MLAIIIIPAFTLWGFGSSSRSRQDSEPAGKIFGKTVSVSEFNKSLSATKTAAIMQFGDEFPKVEKYLDLKSQAWERLMLLEVAKRRKLNVNDQEVVDAIQKAPYFQKNSVFDNKTYAMILRYVFRLQPRTFEEQLRQNLILSKLYDQVTADVKVEDSRIRQEWVDKNQELSIDYIAALFADFAKKIKPADKDIAAYYDKNKETFQEPANLNLEYLSTGSEKESGKITQLIGSKYDLEKISKELNLPKNSTPANVAENQAPTKTETKTTSTSTPTETKPAVASFGNGTHIVGTDIKAGTYRSSGKSTCYWARQKGFGGQLDDIIANGNNSPEIVTIAVSDAAFQTSGCGQWVAVENTYPATPATSFSNGTFEVGKHIAAGTYRADGSPDSLCYWARLSNFSHAGISGVITNGNLPTVISISASDKGFTTFGCGNWTKIQ